MTAYNLARAAQEAPLALAAASRRIRELEEALGSPLFERNARGLLPTAAGRVFFKHGLTLLQTLAHLGSELTDLRQYGGYQSVFATLWHLEWVLPCCPKPMHGRRHSSRWH
jgi:DNA-binding transcriptional LysR family regulator